MSSPVPIFGSQNVHDDDGQVIDSFLIETDAPPDLSQAIEPIPVPVKEPIKRPTRILSGTEILTQTSTPFMLLPPDSNRLHIRLDVFSYATTPGQKDYAIAGDENGKVANANMTQGPFRIRHGKGYTIDDHTGALWITPGPIVADNIEVTWSVVTK